MHKVIDRLPSPAMVVACIALAVALGGTSYAATRLPANSVGTKQIKGGAVTGVKVKRDSLTGNQINESRLGTVPTAARATTADRASVSRLDFRQSAATPIPTSGHVRASVGCDAGLVATGGGAKVSDPDVALVVDTNPLGKTGWEATAGAFSSGATLTVYVICAPAAASTP